MMRRTDGSKPDGVLVIAVVVTVIAGLVFTASPAAAVSDSVELDAALDGQTESTSMSFTFTARQNTTVTADGTLTTAGGSVEFSFDDWENLDSGASGSSNSWTVTNDHTYRVFYDATASSSASESTHSVTAEIVDANGGTVTTEPLSLTVDKVHPQFGSIDDETAEVIFEDASSGSQTVDVDFPNDGAGVMVPTDVTFGNVPNGISVNTDSLSDQVGPDSTGTATLDIDVDRSVSTGSHSFTGTITDNLGNTQSFSVTVNVYKPPVLSADDVEIDGVLRGSSRTIELTVEETGGFGGIDGVDVDVSGSSAYGSVSVSGANSVSTSPGGSDTIEVTVSADSDAPQHADLDWTLELTPQSEHSPTTTFDVGSEVWYPPELGDLEVESTGIVFDEPRDSTRTHRGETTVQFENEGDLEMEVTSVSVSSSTSAITAEDPNNPILVDGTTIGSASVDVFANPDLSEGTYPFTVTVRTDGAGTESVEGEITIEHENELQVSQDTVAFGDVYVGERRTRTVQFSERLGYERIENIQIEQISGPDDWISIENQPNWLGPGESSPVVVTVQFDTSAEPFESYTWEFQIAGDEVESRRFTVSAQPAIQDVDEIVEGLSEQDDQRARIAGPTIDALRSLEQRYQDDEISGADLSQMTAAGRATVFLLNTLPDRERACESDGSQASQSDVIRAAATLNILGAYAERIEDEELRSAVRESVSEGDEVVGELVDCRRGYYLQRLEDSQEGSTTLERASWNWELARLEALRGNTEPAEEYNEQANEAFDTYIDQVEEGAKARQQARSAVDQLEENATLVLGGQSIYLNPATLDSLEDRVDTIDGQYESAASTYRAAGAEQEAQEVLSERREVASRLQLTEYIQWGSTGFYGIVVALGLFRTGRNFYAFLLDRRIVELGQAVG